MYSKIILFICISYTDNCIYTNIQSIYIVCHIQYIDKPKERNSAMNGKDKEFHQATRKKQMRLERKHTSETEIVTTFFISVSLAESFKETLPFLRILQ